MAKIYTYPRVTLATQAALRSSAASEAEDTTILFAPFVAEKGPTNEIVKIHSLAEFLDTYGDPDYATQGQTILNIINWLSAGGTVYAYRISMEPVENLAKGVTSNFYLIAASINDSTNPTFNESTDGNWKTFFEAKLENSSASKFSLYQYNGSEWTNSFLTAKSNDNYYAKLFATGIYKIYDPTDNLVGIIILPTSTSFTSSKDVSAISLKAKYVGSYYNGLKVSLSKATAASINIKVSKDSDVIESFARVTYANLDSTLSASQFITKDSFSQDAFNTIIAADGTSVDIVLANPTTKYTLKKVTDTTEKDLSFSNLNEMLKCFWFSTGDNKYGILLAKDTTNKTITIPLSLSAAASKTSTDSVLFKTAEVVLGNRTETPIDMILDAGYPVAVKKLISAFVAGEDISSSNGVITTSEEDTKAIRNDIVAVFDSYEASSDTSFTFTGSIPSSADFTTTPLFKNVNEAVYEQYMLISEETYVNKDIYVTPTYFLASLIPANDLSNGIQWPVAGLTRGVLSGVKAVSEVYTPTEKQELFDSRINYVEKDSREYVFMSQRTYDGSTEDSYSSLSFLNNTRVMEKMQHDLEKIGRDYLFEFNDSTTLSSMSNEMNKYVQTWVGSKNRILSSGTVVVAADTTSTEKVNATLYIKFVGTVEVIAIKLDIE